MGKGSKKVTVGYWYSLGLHFGICKGPVDALLKIVVGGRTAWSGAQTTSGSLYINKLNLFGGEKREGGLRGTLDVCMGGATQTANSYLTAKLGTPMPAFRGILGGVWRRGRVSAMNPYLKPWAWKVQRILSGWENDAAPWYPEKAQITLDNGDIGANPAHIVYECLTNTQDGMGRDAGQIDDAAFRAAADTFYSEGLGLCLMWAQQAPIEQFIQTVADHAGAGVGEDRATGKIVMYAIRTPTDTSSMLLLDSSNVREVQSFQRPAITDTVNEVTVIYVDVATGEQGSVTVQNLANIQAQADVVSETIKYPGFPNYGLASRAAERDLRVKSTPLAKWRIVANRSAYRLLPGQAFRMTWAPYGMAETVLRALTVRHAGIANGAIEIVAAEDIFGMPMESYLAEQVSLWTPPNTTPVAPTVIAAYEASYLDCVRSMGQSDAEGLATTSGFVGAMAGEPACVTTNFDLLSRIGSESYVKNGTGDWCPTATTSSAVGILDTAIALSGVELPDQIELDAPVLLGTEIVKLMAFDAGTNTITVVRGCVDTVPKTWPSGTRVWFYDPWAGEDINEYASGETVDVKVQTITTTGFLPDAECPVSTVTVGARQARPYPPGDFRVGGLQFPASSSVDLAFSWAHRDRKLQADQIVGYISGGIGPEAGTTYTVRVYNASTSALLRTYAGITGSAQTYTKAQATIDNGGTLPDTIRIELESVRDGLVSWTRYSHGMSWS